MTFARITAVTMILVGWAAPGRAAPVDAQTDAFSGGTTEGWGQGREDHVTWISDGGPLGDGDGYLEVVADGAGAGGKLTVLNADPRWTGDWLAAGITDLEVDLVNDGSTALEVRLKLELGDTQTYSAAVTVPADGQWATYSFGLLPSELRGGAPGAILAGVTALRIEHNPSGTHPPPNLESALGFDNVAAFASGQVCGDGTCGSREDGTTCAADCAPDGGDGGGCQTAGGATSWLVLGLALLGFGLRRRRRDRHR